MAAASSSTSSTTAVQRRPQETATPLPMGPPAMRRRQAELGRVALDDSDLLIAERPGPATHSPTPSSPCRAHRAELLAMAADGRKT
jgi:hypothetical protein